MRIRICSLVVFITFGVTSISGNPNDLPTFQSPGSYNASQMQEAYNAADQYNDVNRWDNVVNANLGLLYSEWESKANAEILTTVDSINTSDHYNSVQDYQQAVFASMQSQEKQALSDWEQKAEMDVMSERSQFVASLSSQDLTSTSGAAPSSSSSADPKTVWKNTFESNLQTGLAAFQTSLGNLSSQYQAILSQVQNTEAQYQQTMQQIRRDEEQVRVGVLGETLSLQQMLYNDVADAQVNTATGEKQYMYHQKNADGSVTLNTSGAELEKFIYNLLGQSVPSNGQYDEGKILSMVADELQKYIYQDGTNTDNVKSGNFLYHQKDSQGNVTLTQEGQSMEGLIYTALGWKQPSNNSFDEQSAYNTLQTQLGNPNYAEVSLTQFTNSMKTFLTDEVGQAQTFVTDYATAAKEKYASESYSLITPDKLFGSTDKTATDSLALAQAIMDGYNAGGYDANGNDPSRHFSKAYYDLRQILALSAYQSLDTVGHLDLQAYDQNTNNYYYQVPIIGNDGTYSDANRYYSKAGADFVNFKQNYIVCIGPWKCGNTSQTVRENYVRIPSFNVSYHDVAAQDNEVIWEQYQGSMQTELDSWKNKIMPAVDSWETKVADFQAKYSTWEQKKTQILSQAEQKYQDGINQIEKNRSTWLGQMSQVNTNTVNAINSNTTTTINLPSVNSGTSSDSQSLAALGSTVPQAATFDSNNFNNLSTLSQQIGSVFSGAQRIGMTSAMTQAALNASQDAGKNMADQLRNQMTLSDTGYSKLLDDLKSQGYTFQYDKGQITGIRNQDGTLLQDDGKTMSLQQFISGDGKSGSSNQYGYCGQNYASCSDYTTHEYKSVALNSDGSITAVKSVHTGAVSWNGGDLTQDSGYTEQTQDQTITIAAAGVVKLAEFGVKNQPTTQATGGLGMNYTPPDQKGVVQKGILKASSGMSSQNLNSISSNTKISAFNTTGSQTTNLIQSSQAVTTLPVGSNQAVGMISPSTSPTNSNSMSFFSNAGWDQKSMTAANNAMNQNFKTFSTQENNAMTTISSQTAILDAADSRGKSEADATRSEDESLASTLLEGGTWQDWAHQQVHQMVQNAYANVLVNTFNMDPDTANYLAGYKMSADAAKKAKAQMARSNAALAVTGDILAPFTGGLSLGLLDSHITNGLDNMALSIAKGNRLISNSTYQNLSNTVNAENALQLFKNDGYTEATLDVMQHNFHMKDDQLKDMKKFVGKYYESQQAKHEIQSEGGGFGIQKMMGGLFGQIYGGLGKLLAGGAQDLGLISKGQSKSIFKNIDTLQGLASGSDLEEGRHSLNSLETEEINKAYISQMFAPAAESMGIEPKDLGELVYNWHEQQEAKKEAKEQRADVAKQIVETAALAVASAFLGPEVFAVEEGGDAAVAGGDAAVDAGGDAAAEASGEGAADAGGDAAADAGGDAGTDGIPKPKPEPGRWAKAVNSFKNTSSNMWGKFTWKQYGALAGPGVVNAGIDYSEGNKNGALSDLLGAAFSVFAAPIQAFTKTLTSAGKFGGLALMPEITWTPGKSSDPWKLVGGSGSKGGWGVNFDVGMPEDSWVNKHGLDAISIGYSPDGHLSGGITGKLPGDVKIPLVFHGGDNPGFDTGIGLPNGKGGINFGSEGNVEVSGPTSYLNENGPESPEEGGEKNGSSNDGKDTKTSPEPTAHNSKKTEPTTRPSRRVAPKPVSEPGGATVTIPEDNGPAMEVGRTAEKWLPGLAKSTKDYLGPGKVQAIKDGAHRVDQWWQNTFGGN